MRPIMTYLHIVNGESAALQLGAALRDAGRDEHVFAMRDDLAVGPLRTVDDSLIARAGFWQRVLNDPDRDMFEEFEQEQRRLSAIADSRIEVVVWHGQSSGDQLLLRRIAYHLRNQPQRLNEIGMTPRELGGAASPHGSASLARFPEAALRARLGTIAPISLLRIGRLALEWQELKLMNSDVRRWRSNSFESESFAEVDAVVLRHLDDAGLSAADLGERIVARTARYFASDTLLAWRCRELAVTGRLSLHGTPPRVSSSPLRDAASA
jgi:hypothetical protein